VLLSDLKQVEGLPSYFKITVQQLGETLNGITYIELKSGEESPGNRWPAAWRGLWNGPGMQGLPIDTASTFAPAAEGQVSSCLKEVASYVSSVLRKRLFPPEPARLLQLRNQALNASLESRKRLEALTELAETKAVALGAKLPWSALRST
jgi:hypothetical protein